MKIMIVADAHMRTKVNKSRQKRSFEALQNAFNKVPCDFAVILGDLMHGPDYGDDKERFIYDLRRALDTTNNLPFAFVFGNHDPESSVTKEEILSIIGEYKNSMTKGQNYVLRIGGETLLFIDSGSEYDGPESYYDIVRPDVINWAKEEIKAERAILFQHIIIPDILDYTEDFGDNKCRFKTGFDYTGEINERPCSPDINTGELEILAPNLKAMVFGHDHVNSFECELMGVKIIQCPSCSVSGYEWPQNPTVKVLDTDTMTTRIYDV